MLPQSNSSVSQRLAAPMHKDFFDRDVAVVARDLIGRTLLFDGVGGTVVETEAYGAQDPASHSFRGPTSSNAAMFSKPGTIYVYRSYGIHWCVNMVCQPGSAVLIRALEPLAGIDQMIDRRGTDRIESLCSGPGKLTMALAITGDHNHQHITESLFELTPPLDAVRIAIDKRIGITKAPETPWRFGLAGSRFVSKRFP